MRRKKKAERFGSQVAAALESFSVLLGIRSMSDISSACRDSLRASKLVFYTWPSWLGKTWLTTNWRRGGRLTPRRSARTPGTLGIHARRNESRRVLHAYVLRCGYCSVTFSAKANRKPCLSQYVTLFCIHNLFQTVPAKQERFPSSVPLE